jgi:phosphatidylserine/phosphatidylglycerophosphate/cardiolipin synthase-like enzyme
VKYRRALVLAEVGNDVSPAVSALRSVAPGLSHVLLVAGVAAPAFAGLFGESNADPDAKTLALLGTMRGKVAEAARTVDVRLAPEINVRALVDLAHAAEIDLLVAGSGSLRVASLLVEARKQLGLPVLSAAGVALPSRPIEHVWCVALGRRARAAIETFLHERVDQTLRVTVLSSVRPPADELPALLEVAGIHSSVELPAPDIASIRRWLAERTPGRAIDLFVFTRAPAVLLVGVSWPAPVLLLPPPLPDERTIQRSLDVADVVDDGGPVRVRVDYAPLVGSASPVPNQSLAFVFEGRVVATATTTSAGEVELPAGLRATSLGLSRADGRRHPDAPASVEERIAVIRPGERAMIVFDSQVSDQTLRALSAFSAAHDVEVLAVRLLPTRTVRAIRERLRAANLPAHVVDARAVLDEGSALDVSEIHDFVRLGRVASRLARAGFRVTGLFRRRSTEPEPLPQDRAELVLESRIELELDNGTARRFLLDAIANSRETVHLQVYMALDDDVGRKVEAALGEAARRGVAVRVLVDSLHGLHGSFGTENPMLSRLSERAGVEVRISRPVQELPSIADLKQRDHRKLLVADGRVALVGGRNLSHEYYTSFEEASVTSTTPWRQVPWLDAGARIEGPLVAKIAASFLEAWSEAGGAPFEIASPPPAGTTPARVVVHRGLRDARTLETYLELIDTARSHVHVVNGFPFMLELEHALLRAIRRGVAVRVLTGHLTPMHEDRPFEGPWASARRAATEFVHSRLDAVVEAGGEAYFFAKRGVPGWEPGLGVVHPHVHAKVMSVDGRRCAVGSANLDFTSSYWESELLVLVEDEQLTREFEVRIESLFADSTRWDRNNPAWKKAASRRAWMRHWPGVLSV